jgi:dTMP kinase
VLVALEGIDGSGKSTVAKLVAKRLRAAGHKVLVTQEPTKTWLGRAVRKGIASRLDPMALAFLFLSDRALHLRQLGDDTKKQIVITDRYADSTTAYQGAALADAMPGALEYFRRLQAERFPRPDLSVLLDIPAEVGVDRIAGRRTKEPFEKVRFLRRVRSNYLRLAKLNGLVVVDATRPLDVVAEKVHSLIARGLA